MSGEEQFGWMVFAFSLTVGLASAVGSGLLAVVAWRYLSPYLRLVFRALT